MLRLFVLSVLVVIGCPFVIRAGAYETVEGLLEKCGIKQGYDSARKSLVVIVKDQREFPDPAHSLMFQKGRSLMARRLALDGKCEIIRTFTQKMTASDSVTSNLIDDKAENTTKCSLVVSAKSRLNGCRVLCSSEDWDAKSRVYTMAMAVVWSDKLERAQRVQCAASDDEWKSWIATLDLSCTVGGRQFTNRNGERAYCGIGCADVEGLKGVRYKKAVAAAENEARMNLIYELYADVATAEVFEENEREVESLEKANEKLVSRFDAQIDAKCQKNGVRTRKVHSSVVKHPVTGRDMCVVVVTGLE